MGMRVTRIRSRAIMGQSDLKLKGTFKLEGLVVIIPHIPTATGLSVWGMVEEVCTFTALSGSPKLHLKGHFDLPFIYALMGPSPIVSGN